MPLWRQMFKLYVVRVCNGELFWNKGWLTLTDRTGLCVIPHLYVCHLHICVFVLSRGLNRRKPDWPLSLKPYLTSLQVIFSQHLARALFARPPTRTGRNCCEWQSADFISQKQLVIHANWRPVLLRPRTNTVFPKIHLNVLVFIRFRNWHLLGILTF